MKAAIISLGSVSSEWTFEAMKKHFDEVDSLDLNEIELSLGSETTILYKGQDLKEYDCIFAKGSFRYAEILASITAYYQGKIYLPIYTRAFSIAHDKMLTHIYLQLHNVPQPTTFLSASAEAAKKILKKVNYPIIMKLPRGTQGKGVMFAESYAAASSMLDTLDTLKQPFLIQEYIDTDGEDIRAIVVGDKVVASMKRKAAVDEKRSNIHQGGHGSPVSLDSYTQKIAIKASRAIGADICGIDILETAKGPVVLEANLSPGLQGITEATGIDVADKIADFLAKKTREQVAKTKDSQEKKIMSELWVPTNDSPDQEIIGTLDFRGDRILLPEIVKKITKFSEDDEVTVKMNKDKLIIEKFKL
jgi:RimK family alpha-L-glutamate ligase